MAYDEERAAPSEEAHEAAKAFDAVLESAVDGFSVTDLTVLIKIQPFLSYVFEEGVSKGEIISRAVQVTSLVERDNALLSEAIQNQ